MLLQLMRLIVLLPYDVAADVVVAVVVDAAGGAAHPPVVDDVACVVASTVPSVRISSLLMYSLLFHCI